MKLEIILAGFLWLSINNVKAQEPSVNSVDISYPFDHMPAVLPGTAQLTWNTDISAKLLDDAHVFVERKIAESINGRSAFWHRDYSSKDAYEASVQPNRERLMKYIGVENKQASFLNRNTGFKDSRPAIFMEKVSNVNDPIFVAETEKYRIYQVRWPVLNKVFGEGLLIQPKKQATANIIAIPDADQTPEQLCGLSPGIPANSQFARSLAENGFQVLIPTLIDRTFLFPGSASQQTYRERIYREAFQMGRHIIGYEVEKVLAGIDWFEQTSPQGTKIGAVGYNEGGLIAMYAAAVDTRIDAVLVSGYFTSRQRIWDEPIYRNVWGLLTEFGDAEIASLIAPRPLIVEYSDVATLVEKVINPGPRPDSINGFPVTGYKGRIQTPSLKEVQSEFNRIETITKKGFQPHYLISGNNNKPLSFGSEKALKKFLDQLLSTGPTIAAGNKSEKSSGAFQHQQVSNIMPVDRRRAFSPKERQFRQAKELEDHVQWLLHISDDERNDFFLYKATPESELKNRGWSTRSYHPYHSPEKFIMKGNEYRKYLYEEVIGKFDDQLLPANARTRKIYDYERWTGYEVLLDVYDSFNAAGIILIPKDLRKSEKRPVVVTQHGRNGIPQELVEGNKAAYNNVAAKLADQGFIVYAPYSLYRGEDRYRFLSRKANSVKGSLFSFIISQNEQTLKWLGSLSFVDAKRIAFYGISYGGEAAMRVPAILEGYAASICSGDFGNWTRKVVDPYFKGSFINTPEWEMSYFNMGNTFSYAEMAYLIFPRPFMVERGHDDLVQPDEWVGYEYSKVKYLYDKFNLEDKTRIEFFNGGHSMRNEGSFQFLHKHLNWP